MVSQAKGQLFVPVWIDDGVVKALVDVNGRMPVQIAGTAITQDVNLQSSDITLDVKESSPITTIEARVYTFYNGSWQNAPTETDGSLHVHIESIDSALLVTQTMPQLLQPGLHSYIGSAWKKQPLIWGFTDTYSELDDNNYLATGFITRQTTAVPTGYVYVVTGITANFTTGTCPGIYIYLTMSAGDVMLASDLAAAVGVPLSVVGSFPLKAGQYVKVGFNISAQPCHVYVYVSGYKMKVDM